MSIRKSLLAEISLGYQNLVMKYIDSTSIILSVIILLNTSCVHYYYAPNSNNVPLFKEKHEARLQAQYTNVGVGSDLTDAIGGFEIQTAYAVGSHTGLQLNYLHIDYTEDNYGSGSGNYIEAAAGYFKPLKNQHWIFETYAGVGTGGVKNVFRTSYTEEAKTALARFFLQPSFGFRSDYFSAALSSKLSIVRFTKSSSSVTKENNPTDYDYIKNLDHKSYFFWEPGLMFRAGAKKIQALSQFSYSVGHANLPFYNMNFSIGAVLLIGPGDKK